MDYIKRSIELDTWLKAQGVVVEPDEFAPVVVQRAHTDADGHTTDDGIDVVLKKAAEEEEPCDGYGGYWVYSPICPFYGPGGEGNLMKALRGWCEKNNRQLVYGLCKGVIHWWVAPYYDSAEQEYFGAGKTDGIALADLLWKIKEGSK